MATASKRLPDEVNLGGCAYKVQESDGMIVFSEAEPVWSQHTRFAFERRTDLWYVSIHGQTADVPVSHIQRAAKLVAEAYGPDFYPKP